MSSEFYTNCIEFKGKIAYRGYDANGKRIHKKLNYKPSLFLPTNIESKYTTFDGKFLNKKQFDDISSCRFFLDQYRDVSNFQIFGNTNFYTCYISDVFENTIVYDDNQIKTLFLDIETSYDSGFPEPHLVQEPVIALTLFDRKNYYVYGIKPYKTLEKNVFYFQCKDEKDLLKRFLDKWEELDPDIVSGWNIEFFDLPYLINRITKLFGEEEAKRLSPWKQFSKRRLVWFGKNIECFTITGIACLDYLEMYRKFVGEVENYKLNTVASAILGEGKLDFDISLKDLYENDFKKFIDYNIKDVELVARIDDKIKLINMVCAIAYDAKVNYIDVFTQVRLWDTLIFNYFRQKNWIVPKKIKNLKTETYEGAYVKEPLIGMHKWVASFDLDSLYPHLIAQFNISPETLKDTEFQTIKLNSLLDKSYDTSYLKEKNLSLAANGHHFCNKKQGFLPEILMKMYEDRKIYKNKMLKSQKHLQEVELELKKRGVAI